MSCSYALSSGSDSDRDSLCSEEEYTDTSNQETDAEEDDYLLVAAIDFGTTYSGYAFSFRHDYDDNPLKVSTQNWTAGSRALVSLKTPTCILFGPDKKFHSFGYEAEDKYSDLSLDGEHHDWFYFRRFKMELFDKMTLKREFSLKDERGKSLPAMIVFSESIRYLKCNMVKLYQSRVPEVQESDIKWVLTVPAIWNDSAKQFMREAAEMADISKKKLAIALEPEAASLYCKHLPVEKFSGITSGFVPFSPGSKYLVLDAGGGTVDITVHEVKEEGRLKELYKANGGNWGGTYVDQSFRNLLADIVGSDVMNKFQEECTADYLDLFREFEVKKRTFKPVMNDRITFKVPISLNEFFRDTKKKEIKEVLSKKVKYKDRVSWIGDKIRMEAAVAKELFKSPCDNIIGHLLKLFQEPAVHDVATVLMVGGFSESPMLQEAVQSFSKNARIIVPEDAGLAVLKGAVIFGHEPATISERKCRYTYGIETSVEFVPGEHPVSKRFFNDDDEPFCGGIFSKHVEIGQTLEYGEPQVEQAYRPVHSDQEGLNIEVYASTEKDPKYVTDPSCTLLGVLEVTLLEKFGDDRPVEVQMTFSGTELEVEAVEVNTGESVSASFNFLG